MELFNLQKSLELPISKLKGVGKFSAGLFSKLGLHSCFDLICHFPTAYDDFSRLQFVEEVVCEKKCCLKLKIVEKFKVLRIRNLKLMKALAVDEKGGFINLVFFNKEFFFKSLQFSKFYIFFGKVELSGQTVQMVSPRLVLESEVGLVAKYGLVARLSNRFVSSKIMQILSSEKIAENLPQSLLLKFNLVGRHKAFYDIHFPADELCLKNARKRLIFEELFFWQLSLRLLKRLQLKKTNAVLKTANLSRFLAALPFELSSSQVEVLNECIADCGREFAMHRMIQGDVGCGKTVIVQALCYLFAQSGFQVAVMAPTEILARQHYKNFSALFASLKIKTGLLVGSLKKAEQVAVLNNLLNGEIKIIVGTHSLFGKQTVFQNLGLVVADEQHRFGVLQRNSLIKKGAAPHVLIMSATPVPRTLAMVLFADMDLSVVKQAPVGKAETKTFHIPPSKRARAFSFLASEVAKGRQAYIVCPLIESGVKKAVALEPYFEKIRASKELKGLKMAMMHGKQTTEQKVRFMNEFAKGEIDVLVATSMVEVGIDNSNATVIIIESAELFGLASLHQLRGRVGRGKFNSFCILISSARTNQAKQRMKAMCEYESGFDISRFDLKLRGPGQFFGTMQHGLFNFKLANLVEHFNLLQVCGRVADEFLSCAEKLKLSSFDEEILHKLEASLRERPIIL